SSDTADLVFEPEATIHVTATRGGDGVALPVRIQVIPSTPPPPTPAAYGVLDELGGRLHQEFSMNGDATLTVPPGEHRVWVTRADADELHGETAPVAAGEPAEVAAVRAHSVGSAGVRCAGVHIHACQSADSSDPVDYKVKGAIADGLDS